MLGVGRGQEGQGVSLWVVLTRAVPGVGAGASLGWAADTGRKPPSPSGLWGMPSFLS